MADNRFSSITNTDLTNQQDDFSVDTKSTDGPNDSGETRWQQDNWTQYFGYYKAIPELNTAIDAKATWTVGKGYKADPNTSLILDRLNGFGRDTFDTILENMIRTYYIGGDAYCEIIREKKGKKKGTLINLKPLDPESIVIIANNKGIIQRYEQASKGEGKNKKIKKEKIFHLSRNRVADEIHGVSVIEKLETVILAKNEAIEDMKTLMHRHVKPMRIWSCTSDDPTELAAYKVKIDNATNLTENMIIPKGVLEHEIAAVPTNATLNPLPWMQYLDSQFYEAVGTPKIIAGGANEITEAAAKIVYLAFQQVVEEEQLFIEEQVGMQLGILIELEFPADLTNELLSDQKKDNETGAAQPNETTAGSGQ